MRKAIVPNLGLGQPWVVKSCCRAVTAARLRFAMFARHLVGARIAASTEAPVAGTTMTI